MSPFQTSSYSGSTAGKKINTIFVYYNLAEETWQQDPGWLADSIIMKASDLRSSIDQKSSFAEARLEQAITDADARWESACKEVLENLDVDVKSSAFSEVDDEHRQQARETCLAILRLTLIEHTYLFMRDQGTFELRPMKNQTCQILPLTKTEWETFELQSRLGLPFLASKDTLEYNRWNVGGSSVWETYHDFAKSSPPKTGSVIPSTREDKTRRNKHNLGSVSPYTPQLGKSQASSSSVQVPNDTQASTETPSSSSKGKKHHPSGKAPWNQPTKGKQQRTKSTRDLQQGSAE